MVSMVLQEYREGGRGRGQGEEERKKERGEGKGKVEWEGEMERESWLVFCQLDTSHSNLRRENLN